MHRLRAMRESLPDEATQYRSVAEAEAGVVVSLQFSVVGLQLLAAFGILDERKGLRV